MSRPIHTDTRVLRPIIEALIFASEEPLAPRLLVRLLAGERDDPKAAAREAEAGADGGVDDVVADDAVTDDAVTDAPVVDVAVAGDDPAGDVAADDDAGADQEETSFPDEAVSNGPSDVVADDEIERDADGAAPAAVDSIEQQREEVGERWLEREIGVEPTGEDERPADGSESADALATAYKDLSRDYRERLFPEEQIVTIDQRLVRRLIDDLNADYEDTGRAFRIVEVAGGFQFATIREYGEYVALLSKEKQRRRLSPAALETLAIIAFRQPISKPEIESIRGVNSDQVLLSLLEKNLVAIIGRSESVGRPLLYGTTDEFLRIFGLNALNELPKLREIEELMEEDAYSAERIEVVTVDPTSDAEQIEAIVGAAGHEEREEGVAEALDVVDTAPDEAEVAEDLDDLDEASLSDRSEYDVDADDERAE